MKTTRETKALFMLKKKSNKVVQTLGKWANLIYNDNDNDDEFLFRLMKRKKNSYT